ncbi:polyprenol phosphomannose-dependent alpha 1,6 mannosyltransferase MptB [Frankia sp. R82]|uniref:polyprenol phosphomannose-dependent alpha 1,6 mannosyltransferase MptB n=1 Tax=Frankia sp. R82 TaxID=2950553 RepID=UPI002044BC0B|nr:polyprenol phosphomannose-dependent alpha 1,6 mannosyltransferase MptB [Frankia sp. R82]MCM3886403.1 polyprenol phosphomannose-dependent alpha 1,6 mannosyltransferase MptB [Frankia sp. R82]
MTSTAPPAWILGLVVAGALAAATAMITEGRLGPRDPNVTDPTSWWGILPSAPPGETTRGVLAGLSALGIIVLCACWGALAFAALVGRVSARTGLLAALVWTLPFAVGPPLFSRDVYAYAGQGELARLGLDPATHGIALLTTAGAPDGSGAAFVRAVDPRWTLTHSPYGGAAVALEKAAAVVGGGPAGAVAALRVLAVVAALALIAGSLRLAGRSPRRRAAVAVLVAANPVVGVHLVGGAHLDAVAAALVVAALVLDRAGHPADLWPAGSRQIDSGQAESRSAGDGWAVLVGAGATGLAALAGNVKATVLPVVVWLVIAHLIVARGARRPVRAGVIRLAADALAVVVVTALCTAAAGFGPTWIHALSTSGALSTGIAPASLLAQTADAVLDLIGVHPTAGTTLRVSRGLCLAAAAAILIGLVLRAWRQPRTSPSEDGPGQGRPPEPSEASPTVARPDLAVVGYGGLAVALANPVVYPWYVATCLPALAILAAVRAEALVSTATAPPGGAQPREAAADHDAPPATPAGGGDRNGGSGMVGGAAVGSVVVSVWLCLATLSPLAATWRLLGAGGVALLVTVLALAGLAAGRTVRAAARRQRPAAPTSTP